MQGIRQRAVEVIHSFIHPAIILPFDHDSPSYLTSHPVQSRAEAVAAARIDVPIVECFKKSSYAENEQRQRPTSRQTPRLPLVLYVHIKAPRGQVEVV